MNGESDLAVSVTFHLSGAFDRNVSSESDVPRPIIKIYPSTYVPDVHNLNFVILFLLTPTNSLS